jgi:hypothetical protein
MQKVLEVYHYDKKIRKGEIDDGGYVIADLDGSYDAYFSCGVSNEESFSRDFIATYNMKKENNFAFDGTIVDYPYQYTTEINFIKKNIGGSETSTTTNLHYLIDKYSSIFLKMDIEGGEYPWLLATDETTLRKFKQIVIEFHGINDNSWGCPLSYKQICLEKLAKTHYIVHAHGNNYGSIKNGIPDVIELTYIEKNYFSSPPVRNRTPFPIRGLDFSNNTAVADFTLTKYPFAVELEIGQQDYMALLYHGEEAYIEKNLSCSLASSNPKYALFSHNYYNTIKELNKEKKHDYVFIGSIDNSPRRKWVIEFAKKYMTENSIFINTDKKSNWKQLGSFDLSNTNIGFNPKKQRNNQSREVQYRIVSENLFYFNALCNSTYVLCPGGIDAPWSFRFYETLMCESIPIVESWHHTYRTLEESMIPYKYVLADNILEHNPVVNKNFVKENTELFVKYHTLPLSPK